MPGRLASTSYTWSLSLINVNIVDRKHWARGMGPVQIGFLPQGKQLLGIDVDESAVEYAQGPLLAKGDRSDLRPANRWQLSRRRWRKRAPSGVMVGTIAIASGIYGDGRVICISPHPERSAGLDGLVRHAVTWVASSREAVRDGRQPSRLRRVKPPACGGILLEGPKKQHSHLSDPLIRMMQVVIAAVVLEDIRESILPLLLGVRPEIRPPTQPGAFTSPLAGSKFSSALPWICCSISHFTAYPVSYENGSVLPQLRPAAVTSAAEVNHFHVRELAVDDANDLAQFPLKHLGVVGEWVIHRAIVLIDAHHLELTGAELGVGFFEPDDLNLGGGDACLFQM